MSLLDDLARGIGGFVRDVEKGTQRFGGEVAKGATQAGRGAQTVGSVGGAMLGAAPALMLDTLSLPLRYNDAMKVPTGGQNQRSRAFYPMLNGVADLMNLGMHNINTMGQMQQQRPSLPTYLPSPRMKPYQVMPRIPDGEYYAPADPYGYKDYLGA